MNMLPKKTTMECLPMIASLYQQNVISAEEKNELVLLIESSDKEGLFKAANAIFNKTENRSAKMLLDILYRAN